MRILMNLITEDAITSPTLKKKTPPLRETDPLPWAYLCGIITFHSRVTDCPRFWYDKEQFCESITSFFSFFSSLLKAEISRINIYIGPVGLLSLSLLFAFLFFFLSSVSLSSSQCFVNMQILIYSWGETNWGAPGIYTIFFTSPFSPFTFHLSPFVCPVCNYSLHSSHLFADLFHIPWNPFSLPPIYTILTQICQLVMPGVPRVNE